MFFRQYGAGGVELRVHVVYEFSPAYRCVRKEDDCAEGATGDAEKNKKSAWIERFSVESRRDQDERQLNEERRFVYQRKRPVCPTLRLFS